MEQCWCTAHHTKSKDVLFLGRLEGLVWIINFQKRTNKFCDHHNPTGIVYTTTEKQTTPSGGSTQYDQQTHYIVHRGVFSEMNLI